MSSNNVVDEFVVKVRVDSEDYEKGVEQLTESNDKLQDKLSKTEEATQKVTESSSKLGESFNEAGGKTEEFSEKNDKLNEGLEDTEKQMQKTGKSTRENAKDIKNTTDEFQKLSTGIGTALSLLGKFAGSMAAGTGFLKLASDITKANVALDNTAKLHGESYQTLKKWEYTASELGGDSQAMIASIEKIKAGATLLDISGDDSMLRFLNTFNVPFKDDKTGKALPINDILLNLTKAFQEKEIPDVYQFTKAHGLEGLEPLLLNSPQKVREVLQRQDKRFIASDADIDKMRDFRNNIAEIKNQFDSLNTLFVTGMLPTLIELQEIVKGVLEYFQENPEQAKIAGTIAGAGAIVGGGWGIGKILTLLSGGKGGKGGALTNHVQKVFVVNMGQGGFPDAKSGKVGAGVIPVLGWATGVGYLGYVAADTWYDHLTDSASETDRKEVSYIDDFINRYGEDAVNDAFRGYRSSAKDGEWKDEPVHVLEPALRDYDSKQGMREKYGDEYLQSIYEKSRGFWSFGDSGSWDQAHSSELERLINHYGEPKKDGEEVTDTKKVEADVKREPNSALAVGGIGSVVDRELKDGNILAREANSWLKQLYTNPTLKNIEDILERVFPKNADKIILPWGGEVNQPSASSALSYSGSNTVRDEDYDGDGVSPHTGLDGASMMDFINRQNQAEDSLQARQGMAINYMMRNGWTREQAVGLVANFTAESGLQANALNPNEEVNGVKFESRGIAQWNRGRLDNLSRELGKDITESTFLEQLAFVQWELENTHKTAGRALKNARTVEEATEVVTRYYEVPANMNDEIRKRQSIARDLVDTGFNPYQMMVNQLQMPTRQQQAVAGNTSKVDVTIGNVTVQTTAQTLSGVGEDMAEAVKARMMLGQLTTGAV